MGYHNNLSQFYKLISHLNQHLKYLTFGQFGIVNVKKTLEGLGQVLPNTLEYLDLRLDVDPDDLKNFLDHCKHVELKKLLVKNRHSKKVDVTFNTLKEFVKVEDFAYLIGVSF